MSSKEIPARTVYTCDVCKTATTENIEEYKKQHWLAVSIQFPRQGNREYDVCPQCRPKVEAVFYPVQEQTPRRAKPCGGCGNDDPELRCVGCAHQF